MKKIVMYFTCILAFEGMLLQTSMAQIMLQKAVISNGGGIAVNSTTTGALVVGQTAVGMASNNQMTGHFGFFATPNAVNAVAGHGAGAISSLLLTPNPASNDVAINITLAQTENLDLFLYDASGHIVSTIYSGKKEAGSFRERFEVKSLASGAYFIAARIPGALVQAKLTVVR